MLLFSLGGRMAKHGKAPPDAHGCLPCWGCGVLASQPNFQLMLMMLVFGLLYGPAGASMMPADARDACPSGLASQQKSQLNAHDAALFVVRARLGRA